MKTVLTPCRVPWSISPTTSGLTLTHVETDVLPECTIVLGGGRLQADDRTDDRRIELVFDGCYFARVGPHSDMEGIESIGYEIVPMTKDKGVDYLRWRQAHWRASGICPDSGFYVALSSLWSSSLPATYHDGFRHYVVDGRDGYVEVIARRFRWQEWKWLGGHRESATAGEVVGVGEGVA